MEKHTNDLTINQEIAGYCRISVDEELDRDNTSIENQKKIIEEFVKLSFPRVSSLYMKTVTVPDIPLSSVKDTSSFGRN